MISVTRYPLRLTFSRFTILTPLIYSVASAVKLPVSLESEITYEAGEIPALKHDNQGYQASCI